MRLRTPIWGGCLVVLGYALFLTLPPIPVWTLPAEERFTYLDVERNLLITMGKLKGVSLWDAGTGVNRGRFLEDSYIHDFNYHHPRYLLMLVVSEKGQRDYFLGVLDRETGTLKKVPLDKNQPNTVKSFFTARPIRGSGDRLWVEVNAQGRKPEVKCQFVIDVRREKLVFGCEEGDPEILGFPTENQMVRSGRISGQQGWRDEGVNLETGKTIWKRNPLHLQGLPSILIAEEQILLSESLEPGITPHWKIIDARTGRDLNWVKKTSSAEDFFMEDPARAECFLTADRANFLPIRVYSRTTGKLVETLTDSRLKGTWTFSPDGKYLGVEGGRTNRFFEWPSRKLVFEGGEAARAANFQFRDSSTLVLLLAGALMGQGEVRLVRLDTGETQTFPDTLWEHGPIHQGPLVSLRGSRVGKDRGFWQTWIDRLVGREANPHTSGLVVDTRTFETFELPPQPENASYVAVPRAKVALRIWNDAAEEGIAAYCLPVRKPWAWIVGVPVGLAGLGWLWGSGRSWKRT